MRHFVGAAAVLGWLALILQLYLMLRSATEVIAAAAIVISYFSFFTILTNVMIALVLTFSRWRWNSRVGKFLSSPTVQSAAAVYIAIVGIVYSLLLRHLWNPHGAQKLADVLLHDAMPVIYVLFWLFFVSKKELRPKDAVAWLAYPGIYLFYVLSRGAIFGLYPYPFIDVRELGYGRTLGNAALFLLVFLGLGLFTVGVGRSKWFRGRGLEEGGPPD